MLRYVCLLRDTSLRCRWQMERSTGPRFTATSWIKHELLGHCPMKKTITFSIRCWQGSHKKNEVSWRVFRGNITIYKTFSFFSHAHIPTANNATELSPSWEITPAQPLKKFTACDGLQRFPTMFTTADHWSLPSSRRIQSTPSHPIYFCQYFIA